MEIQGLMGRPPLKLIQEMKTRWKSTFDMLQCEPVGAARPNLCDHSTDKLYVVIHECMTLLQSFELATTELSEEERISAFNLIPL